MTSNDFNTVHVIDDRLKFWDSANYAVKTGGQSITTSVFNAQSASVNSHSWCSIDSPVWKRYPTTILFSSRLYWKLQLTVYSHSEKSLIC